MRKEVFSTSKGVKTSVLRDDWRKGEEQKEEHHRTPQKSLKSQIRREFCDKGDALQI